LGRDGRRRPARSAAFARRNAPQAPLDVGVGCSYGAGPRAVEYETAFLLSENMPGYQDTPFVFFDIETTGLRNGHNEITEIAFIHDKLGSWCMRVKPKYPERFEDVAREISGYSEVEWAGAPYLEDVIDKVREFTYESIIVGHNVVGFDIPFSNGNFEMLGIDFRLPLSMNWVIDTQMLALVHMVPQGLKRIGLSPCCAFFGISNDGKHHAYDDCARSKLVFEALLRKLRWDDGKPKQKELW